MQPQHDALIAGVYLRLSKEDKARDDRIQTGDNSESIESQKLALNKYAKERGMIIHDHYIDDGYSGAKDFNESTRPDFMRMLEDIEAGAINTVLVKDLSRLGRNYIEVGRYQEIIFPEKGIRLIAPGDGYDSANGDDDISPIRNMFNDFYARDTSKKVRKALAVRAQSGMYIGNGVYGYRKSPENRHKLIVDETTAPVVRRIFSLAASGYGYGKIARILQADGVPNPAAAKRKDPKKPYYSDCSWHMSTVRQIVQNPVYLGHLVQLKRRVQSYRVNKILDNPADQWATAENTHEPIIDQNTWDTAQTVLATHKKVCKTGEPHIFAGLIRCGDCGAPLAKDGSKGAFSCSVYKKQGKQYCTTHRITMDKLSAVVLDSIRGITERIRDDKSAFISELSGVSVSQSQQKRNILQKELGQKQKRLEKLAVLTRKVFEQNIDGILPDETYRQMLNDYSAEKTALQEQLAALTAQISELEQDANNVLDFVGLIEKYCDVAELDSSILHELIERIDVYQTQRIDGMKHQRIDISYRFIGQI